MTAVRVDADFRQAQRLFLDRGDDASFLSDAGAPLEAHSAALERPRLAPATVIEGTTQRIRRVFGEPTVAFAAFLDGTQHSRVVHWSAGYPVVLGTVAAVVRSRVNRRMTTWRRPLVRKALYLPREFMPAATWDRASSGSLPVVDTSAPNARGERPDPHPFTLLEAAVHHVQLAREMTERELAEDWCRIENGPLFIDGGVSRGELVARSTCVAGVVKSHRTLYVDGEELRAVLGMGQGHRSSVFRVTSSSRTPVASWYLRVRDPAGHDPTWGLVRVEIAEPDRTLPPAKLADRADEVSRWVMAESTPLALPDGRWDKMMYGVRDCEEFLRAIV